MSTLLGTANMGSSDMEMSTPGTAFVNLYVVIMCSSEINYSLYIQEVHGKVKNSILLS